MSNNNKTPAIRFKGFTDTWEQRKLSDMVERVTRKNENLESELPLTISAQYGLIDQNEFFDKRIASRDVSGYYLLKKGEFAYNKSTSSDAPWGAVKRLDRYEMGVLSTLYIVFALKEDGNIDSDFLVSYYDTDCWHKGVQAIAAEGARNHGLLNITPADYFETVLTVPSDVKEQHQIGTFFAKLDTLITLHQRKYDKLTKVKKAMLKKMFPQNGANKPEIRFRGFTDGWEHCKLNSIADVRDGTHASPQYFSSGHPFITSKNVKDGYINYDDVQYISDEDYEEINKRSKVDVNDILMGMIGTIGNLALIREEPDFAIKNVALIKDTGDIFYLYLYHYLQSETVLNQLLENMDGGTQKFVALKRIRELNIAFPIKSEQQAIGTYFHNLDSVITLHQRKCDKYKSIKAGLIRKLFP